MLPGTKSPKTKWVTVFGRGMGSARAVGTLLLTALAASAPMVSPAATPRQKSLDEWRGLTAQREPPKVFVKGDNVRFYFHQGTNVQEFNGHWSRVRIPSDGYHVNTALLQWTQKLRRMPEGQKGWRQATVISGADWRRLAIRSKTSHVSYTGMEPRT